MEHAGPHFPVQGFLLLGSGKCVKAPVSLCPAWAQSLRTESRLLQPLHLPSGVPSRTGYFPGRGVCPREPSLPYRSFPGDTSPVLTLFYFLFYLDSWRSVLQLWLYRRRSSARFQTVFCENGPTCRFIVGVLVGGGEPHTPQVHHPSDPCLLLWREMSPIPSKSIIFLISVSH